VTQYLFVGCILAGLYVIFIWPTQRLYSSFDNLERNAKRVITGTQLQQWAMGLLASEPTNPTPKVADLGTNFPPQLLGLIRHRPYIQVQEANTNSPGSVLLVWGSGFLGHSGFEIGPTIFVSYRPNAQAWQPGVYFWTDSPKRRR